MDCLLIRGDTFHTQGSYQGEGESYPILNTSKSSSALFIRNRPLNIELQGWFVKMGQGGFQQSHIHAPGWVSGIVYLKTIDDPLTDQGAIEFGRANYDFLTDNDNQEVYLYKPRIGDIILFPSSLFHRTIPIESKKERSLI